MASRVEYVAILPKIIVTRMLATHPTKVSVGEDYEDRLTDGLTAL